MCPCVNQGGTNHNYDTTETYNPVWGYTYRYKNIRQFPPQIISNEHSPSSRKFPQNPADIIQWKIPPGYSSMKNTPLNAGSASLPMNGIFFYKPYSSMSLLQHSHLCTDRVSMQLLKMISVMNTFATSIYT